MKLLTLILYLYTAHGLAEVDVLTYHDQPPFIIDKANKKGLTYDIIDHINRSMKTTYHIRVLPKLRVKKMLDSKKGALMIWAVSLTFGGIENAKQTKLVWSKPLLSDQQSFISRSTHPIEYLGPESLYGRVLGGVQGHTYFGLQADIESEKITRINATKEDKNITRLLANRLDVVTMAESSAKYYGNLLQVGDKLYFSEKPLNYYSRHFLASQQLSEHIVMFNRWLDASMQNSTLTKLLTQYGLQTLLPDQP